MVLPKQPGRLNAFQQAMLQWNDMHPYHAVHVVRLEGSPDLERLCQIITTLLRLHGLSGLQLDRKRGTFQFDGEPVPVELREVTTHRDPVGSLTSEIESQLNLRFDITGRFSPFRFFLLPDRDSFLFGATYFHPIADAESMAILLRQLVTAYLGVQSRESSSPLHCHPRRHDRLFFSRPRVLVHKLLSLPSDIRMMRRSYRARLHDAEDLGNRFRSSTIPGSIQSRLVETAHAWKITLHDLLLAVLMKALSPLDPDRLHKRRRRHISLGSIVNVRRDYEIDGKRTFGLFLGSFVVTHLVPDAIPLKELALDLHHQTRRIKAGKRYLATPLELSLAGRVIALYSTPRQRKFYHKHHPLWAGVTNMNMNPFWPEALPARPLDYFRAVSTGPVTPLVLSASTFGDHMNIGLTYRPAVFNTQAIDQVQTGLLEQFDELKENS